MSTRECTWADALIKQYRESKREVLTLHNHYKHLAQIARECRDFAAMSAAEEAARQLSRIAADCRFSISSLERYSSTGTKVSTSIQVSQFDPVRLDAIAATYDTYEGLEEEDEVQASPQNLDLRCLSVREKDVLMLYVLDGMSWAEIADQLNISRSSVQKYINRAFSKLNRMRNEGVQLTLLDTPTISEGTYVHGLSRDKPSQDKTRKVSMGRRFKVHRGHEAIGRQVSLNGLASEQINVVSMR